LETGSVLDPTVRDSLGLDYEGSELHRLLASFPLSFGSEGIWFSNIGQALDVAGVPSPGSAEEFRSWPEDEREQYREALGGIFGSRLFVVMRQTPKWSDALGFSEFQVDAAISTGPIDTWPFATSFHTGRFDADVVDGRLGALGYRVESSGTWDFHSVDDDVLREQRASPVGSALYQSRAKRIFVADDVLVSSPDTDPMVQVLSTHDGQSSSLDQAESFSRVALEIADPLRAVILTREMVLESEETPPLDYDPPPSWVSLQEWDLFGAAYGRTADVVTNHIVLHYPQPEWAELDAAELPRRVEHFLEELERDRPVREFCQSWESAVTAYDTGSVLTVTCETPVADAVGAGVVELVSPRVLGFLAP
jgi:hypothetical protein